MYGCCVERIQNAMVKTSKNQHVPRSCRFESSLDSITCSHFKTRTILLGCGDAPQICITARKEDQDRAKKAGSSVRCWILLKFSLSATTGKGCRALAGVAREGAIFLYKAIIPIKGDSSVTRQLGVSENVVYPEKPNGFADHYPYEIYEKWLFHWEY